MTGQSETQWSATSPRLVRYIWVLWVIWLIFLWYPISSLFAAHPSSLHLAVVLLAAAIFCALYVWNIVRNLEQLRLEGLPRAPWLVLAVMAVIALALTVGDRRDWIELFIFLTVSLGPSLPVRQALIGVGLLVLLAPILGAVVGASPSQVAQMVFQPAISGVAVIIVVRTVVLDRELRKARAEIARLAVSEERLRFARDLHDLLGHSLSLIALKSELAGRLATASPERAAAEMRDVEDVARTALQEVREAVAGYRQARLGDELQNAREILEAAGITYQCVGDVPALPAAQEAALSWAVREGVTNVIKHSRASNCTVRIERRGHEVGIAIEDDGRGSDAASQASGSGLAGLEERVTALGGRFDAGPQPDGGFRLTVAVPLTGARTGSRDAEAARSA